ncbi:hypothetical protein ABS648_03425 [Pseudomonas solani]|uniref:Uncharacterized protein n=1 Tax=Pseudomonas solani TaxID=2731552 RepID=A0AAU7Y4H8_9PSED
MTDLSVAFPERISGLVNGRRVEIHPVRLGQLEAFGQSVQPLLTLLQSFSDVQSLGQYAEQHASSLRKALRLTTSLNRIQLYFMPASAALELFAVVVQVNARFFGEALARVGSALAGVQASSA